MRKIIILVFFPLASIAQTATDTIISNIDTTLETVQKILETVPIGGESSSWIGWSIGAIVSIIGLIMGVWIKKKKKK